MNYSRVGPRMFKGLLLVITAPLWLPIGLVIFALYKLGAWYEESK